MDAWAETLSPYGYGMNLCYVFSADFRPALMDRMHPMDVSGCQPDTSKVHTWLQEARTSLSTLIAGPASYYRV